MNRTQFRIFVFLVFLVSAVGLLVHPQTTVQAQTELTTSSVEAKQNTSLRVSKADQGSDAMWRLEVPSGADKWWNNLPRVKRMGVLLIATVVAVIALVLARVFLVLSVAYFLICLVATLSTRNFFWLFTGFSILVSAGVALGFNNAALRQQSTSDT